MDYTTFFVELLTQFLSGAISRAEVAERIAFTMPVDTDYLDDEDLMNNCEWALRHINEPGYYSTEAELAYYLSCLKGENKYSQEERDKNI